jgi:hypothetical protein
MFVPVWKPAMQINGLVNGLLPMFDEVRLCCRLIRSHCTPSTDRRSLAGREIPMNGTLALAHLRRRLRIRGEAEVSGTFVFGGWTMYDILVTTSDDLPKAMGGWQHPVRQPAPC